MPKIFFLLLHLESLLFSFCIRDIILLFSALLCPSFAILCYMQQNKCLSYTGLIHSCAIAEAFSTVSSDINGSIFLLLTAK